MSLKELCHDDLVPELLVCILRGVSARLIPFVLF